MGFQSAGKFEIIRSAHKDDQVCSQLRLGAAELAQHILGAQVWFKYRQELEVATDVLYFFLTTLNDLQTLGEEYVYLVQVKSSKRQLPSKLRRSWMVFLQVANPYLVNKLLKHLETNSKSPLTRRFLHLLSFLKLRSSAGSIRWAWQFLQRCHLASFYLKGSHYHVSKRVADIHYVLLRGWLKFTLQQHVFSVLGILLTSQLMVETFTACKKYWPSSPFGQSSPQATFTGASAVSNGDGTTSDSPASDSSSAVTLAQQCPLCLDRRCHTTCLQCGHLFCWTCIVSWMQTNHHCPICRDALHPSTVVPLVNYD